MSSTLGELRSLLKLRRTPIGTYRLRAAIRWVERRKRLAQAKARARLRRTARERTQ